MADPKEKNEEEEVAGGMFFAEEDEEGDEDDTDIKPWKVLVVDDEEGVHVLNFGWQLAQIVNTLSRHGGCFPQVRRE